MKKFLVVILLVLASVSLAGAFEYAGEDQTQSDEVAVEYATKAEFNSLSSRITRLERAIKSIGGNSNKHAAKKATASKTTKVKKAKLVPKKGVFKGNDSRDCAILTLFALGALLSIFVIILWFRNARQHRTFQCRE